VEAQHLRPKAWLLAVAVGAAALFAAGALFTYTRSGWTWTSLGLAGMLAVAVAGVVEVATSRVVLRDDALECGAVWSRRRIAAADIDSVTWERGAGVAVKLTNGAWAKLPELGYNSQGLANKLRAWLNRTRRGHA
jgi:hypothetical protein